MSVSLDHSYKINVLVDNPSWVLTFAETLVNSANEQGHDARICRTHEEVQAADVTFFLGCVKIAPPSLLALSGRNLVVHASDLPKGRGFSPLSWLTLEGEKEIPVCLIDAGKDVDSGDIIYKDKITFEGHELLDEMQDVLGNKQVELCLRFISEAPLPDGRPQEGEPDFYARRSPKDSRLDPDQNIRSQFNLLRIVDNEKYPAFFELNGHRYNLFIEKADSESET